MQFTDNESIKQQLLKEVKQFQSKQTAIPYFMSYDFPDKQKALKSFWQELIETIIKHKRQIYVTYRDLQFITTIYNLKPIPLKKILFQLKKDSVFLREEDLTQDKPIQKKTKPWYSSIMELAWAKPSPPQFQWPFTFSPQEKIIGYKPKERKKLELITYFHAVFNQENSKIMAEFIYEISDQIKIDKDSVHILLKEMVKQQEAYIGQVEGLGEILVYHKDRKKILDENFIKVEKIKWMLHSQEQKLGFLFEKSSNKIANLKLKAKEALLKEDKKKARAFVAHAKTEENHRELIEVRIKVIRQKISQIELNQMNKSTIDAMEEAQRVYQECSVDSEKFEDIMQKEREQKQEMEMGNAKFQEMDDSGDIEDEVDKLMKEIENDSKEKIIEEKRVHVNLPNQYQEIEIDRPNFMYN